MKKKKELSIKCVRVRIGVPQTNYAKNFPFAFSTELIIEVMYVNRFLPILWVLRHIKS